MKIISNFQQLSIEELDKLKLMINTSFIKFDFEQSQYVTYNRLTSSFEVMWPGVLTLISNSNDEKTVNIEFGSENTLDVVKFEKINFRINNSSKDNKNSRGIMMDNFNVKRIDIYSNNTTDILDDKTYGNSVTNFLRTQNCKELEYINQTDEIIVLTSSENKRLMLEATDSMNGSIILNFDEKHIDLVLTNQHYNYSPKKNYSKRMTID